ncbi:MAG TPA: MoaD/ThiS family protein [Chitinophagaceae bacterium]|nr:MoaD/ThiS family protein [Chitinophagaceae bacterium]
MNLKVIMFGRLADIAGNALSVSAADTDSLIKTLHKDYPALASTKYLIAVDKQIITENTALTNNSIVALLPPFSGG